MWKSVNQEPGRVWFLPLPDFHMRGVDQIDRAVSLTAPAMFVSVLLSSTMLILRGSPAFSPFRLQKLLQDLGGAGVKVRAIQAEFAHVIELARELSGPERAVLDQLLTYGPSRAASEV